MLTNKYKFFKNLDKTFLGCIFILFFTSILVINISSKAVALRIGVNQDYFINKQILFLIIGFLVIAIISRLNIKEIKRLSIFGFLVSITLLILTKIFGQETKGAKRWISFLGFSIQASEFIKPFFWVVVGFILSKKDEDANFPGIKICIFLYVTVGMLLISQPDFGMLILISSVFFIQLFISGIHIIWIFLCGILCVVISFLSYIFLPHVSKRILDFLDFANNENYQIKKSLQAFYNGGFFGKGIGEGVVKKTLPDSHTDFVFAVIGEEFGAIFCIIICLTFACIVARGCFLVSREENKFKAISLTGIISQIAVQSIINIGVSIRIFPAKGMTLPIISYGGSSTISMCIGFGILLAFTKTNLASKYKMKHFI